MTDTDLSPFVAAMRRRGRPFKLVTLPGTTDKVAVWVPTVNERAEADAEARTHLTKTLKLDALQLSLAMSTELHEREVHVELLARVLRDPSDPTQAYVESAEDLRDDENGFTDEDRRALMASVDAFARERYEPAIPEADDKICELVRRLKADGRLSEFVTSCGSDTLRSIVLSLAGASPTPTPPSS